MKRPSDEMLLAFLEGSMPEDEREELLDALDGDEALAERLRAAAVGLEALRALAVTAPAGYREGAPARAAGVSPWWVAAAAAAALLVAVPITWVAARASAPIGPASSGGGVAGEDAGASAGARNSSPAGSAEIAGMPADPQPSYVLVLHGIWPDAGEVEAAEVQERAREYWGWTAALAEQGILLAAGDLRWEPGERLGSEGRAIPVADDIIQSPDYLVGMLAVRADSYEEAVALANECPHLRYGGSVSVRRVGGGFVTTPGSGDW